MGLLDQSLVLYVLVGIGVAGAVYTTDRGSTGRWFRVLTALPFWPIYLPILLASRGQAATDLGKPAAAHDDMARAILQVDGELDAALKSLDGWAENLLARECGRISELRAAWSLQAERIREMDRLLSLPDYAVPVPESSELPSETADRLRQSQRARRQNIDRLRQVRQRAYDDLMGMLAWVRELVSMIHLAKFTGAPPSRAEELLAQIAAAIEGLSALTWQEDHA